MPLNSKKSRVALFFAFGVGLAVLMAGLKAVIAWAADTYLYSVPWLGGFLRSIELLEISNLLIFAILGAGIGAATVWLPRHWPHRAKLAFLLLLSPFVFSASYMMQQNLWIKAVATRANLPYREARDITNAYLKREVGKGGFFGFYPFSTQFAELPTRLDSLQSEQSVNPNDLLSQELSGYNDSRADLAAYVFERVGWLIRFMYMTIAALTGLIYYFKGHSWAENRAYAKAAPASMPARSAPQKTAPKPKKSASQRPNSPGQSSRKPSGNQSSSNSLGNPSENAPGKPIIKPYINAPSDIPLNGSVPEPPGQSSNRPNEDATS